MCAKPSNTFTSNHDSPSSLKRSVPRLRFARSAGPMEKMKDVKVAWDIIIRPSIQLWKLALRRSGLKYIASKRARAQRIVIPGDDASDTSSCTASKKRVRFDEQPVTITRKGFLERCRRDSSSSSSPARPCLIIREYEDSGAHREFPERLAPESDCRSVYEDCFSDHPGFIIDLYPFDSASDDGDDERGSNTRSPKRIRRSEFYETESGIAMFDRMGYANYCLELWLDKQREEARSPRKCVFEGPALRPRPSRTLRPPPTSRTSDVLACSMPLLQAPVCRSRQSLPWRIWKYVEDELQNAFVVLIIGLFIHICLCLFLLYDILTRGFVPSDD